MSGLSAHSQPVVQVPMATSMWPRKQPFNPNILVMRGGGLKGLAYIGALKVLKAHDFNFSHYVGTSVGAIFAAFLAVGYSATELEAILKDKDFRDFKDGGWSAFLSLLIHNGLYEGEAFRTWIDEKLREKVPGFNKAIPIRFKHLKNLKPPNRLTIFASHEGERNFCLDSEKDSETEISFACRCSMAIPYFFRPVTIGRDYVVDGGMQNNYPIFGLLERFPDLVNSSDFLGLYLGSKRPQRRSKRFFSRLYSMQKGLGDEQAKEAFIDRTIVIDPHPVRTTDFSLSANEKNFLLAEGEASTLRWLFESQYVNRPTEEAVTEAEEESDKLRNIVIAERRKFFW